MLEPHALVEADRGVVEGVDVRGYFLIAAFEEIEAHDQVDGLGGVALALVLRGDGQTILERAVTRATFEGGLARRKRRKLRRITSA